MQPIIEQVRTISGGSIGLVVGIILLGLLIVQIVGLCYGTVRRLYFESEQRELSRERLRQQIKAAKLQTQEAEQAKLLWNGFRKFQVAKKISECDGVESFYLAPHDGRSLPPFKPGQYITFQLNIPGESKPVIRCYSLSDGPRRDYYRVTIKKVCADAEKGLPAGRASCFFYDKIQVGDILNVKAPGGHFYLDLNEEKPVVLISGGVGITPMISMLNAIIETGSKREMWFFFGARNRSEHIQKEYLEKIAAEHDNVHLHICYSRPASEEVAGRDYHHAGHVSIDLLKKLLPSNNYEYFICGPGAMMKSMTDGLSAWGVPDKSVHFEAFGPATVKKAAPAPTPSETVFLSRVKVTFGRSGKTCHWTTGTSSLLDLAEENGIRIDAGCRAGNCGTCLVAIKSGDVEYLTEHGASAEKGSCLTCICKPKSDLVLDA